MDFYCAWSLPCWGQAEVVSTRLNPNHGTRYVGGVCHFLRLSHCRKDLKWRTSVTDQLQLSFIQQAKNSRPLMHEGMLNPKGERLNLAWLPLFIHFVSSLLSLPYANWASQEGDMFVSPEVFILVHAFSFVPFLWAFPFLFLLATTILDSFFLF